MNNKLNHEVVTNELVLSGCIFFILSIDTKGKSQSIEFQRTNKSKPLMVYLRATRLGVPAPSRFRTCLSFSSTMPPDRDIGRATVPHVSVNETGI